MSHAKRIFLPIRQWSPEAARTPAALEICFAPLHCLPAVYNNDDAAYRELHFAMPLTDHQLRRVRSELSSPRNKQHFPYYQDSGLGRPRRALNPFVAISARNNGRPRRAARDHLIEPIAWKRVPLLPFVDSQRVPSTAVIYDPLTVKCGTLYISLWRFFRAEPPDKA